MTIEIYQDAKKEFRWRMLVRGRVIADSGEGYKRKAKLKRTVLALAQRLGSGDYKVVDA